MNNRERESLVKSFFLFYLSMQFLVGTILYLYYQSEVANAKESLFLRMQNYSFTLQGDAFGVDIKSKSEAVKNFVLYEENELFAYFPISGVEDSVLKISLPLEAFKSSLDALLASIGWYFLFSAVVLILLAFVFSLYTLRPLRQSIRFLEEFLKDIIHDLNTPVTAILLNTKMLEKGFKPERLKRIALSAKTIASLHKNLESYLQELPLARETVDLRALLQERCDYFQTLFPHLHLSFHGCERQILSNEDALRRIIDNLLGNACKYNREQGFVKVTLDTEGFTIEDSGVGIKNPQRVFERFYKEGERGLGIGLHIVKKLCGALDLTISLKSSKAGSLFSVRC